MRISVKKLILACVAFVFLFNICYHPTATTSTGSPSLNVTTPKACDSPPVTSINFTTPPYGASNWISGTNNITLSASGGNITTAYAVDTSMVPEETFEEYSDGGTVSGAQWAISGTSASSYFKGLTGDYGHSGIVGHYYDQDTSVDLSTTYTFTTAGPDTAGNYIQFDVLLSSGSGENWVITPMDANGNIYFFIGISYGWNIFFWQSWATGGGYLFTSINANTWYTIRITISSDTSKCDFGASTDGGSTWIGGSPTYFNNGGSHWDPGYPMGTLAKIRAYCHGNAAGKVDGQLDNIEASWIYSFPHADWTNISSGSSFNFNTGNIHPSKTDGMQYIIGYNSTANGVKENTKIVTVTLDTSPPTTI